MLVFQTLFGSLGQVDIFALTFLVNKYHDQGWEFAHSFIAHLLICSNSSRQMSYCEQITQVAHDK